MATEAKAAFSSPLLAPKAVGVALVTGCSEGGIGHALAMELAARHFHVIASSRSASTIAQSLQELPNVDVMDLDVSSLDSIAQAVSSIIQKHGRIDILINNAGVPCHAPTAEIPLSLLESTFKTNVFGPIALIEAVVPYMVEAGQGKIVNIGSIGGFIAGPWVGAYSASKSALHALTDSLRVELKPFGVQVILVAPGGVLTNITKNSLSVIRDLKYKIYKPYEEAIVTRAKYSQSPHSVSPSLFAKRTIDAVLKRNPPICFTYGYLAKTYTFLYYMPLWVRDWYFLRKSSILKLVNTAKTGKLN